MMQDKLNEHLDEMEQYTKTKGKNVRVLHSFDVKRDVLKQLSELRRTKEKKVLQMKELIDKANDYIRMNPAQPIAY